MSHEDRALVLYARALRLPPRARFYLARLLLTQLLAEGITYADFEAAQAAQRNIRKASNAIEGIR